MTGGQTSVDGAHGAGDDAVQPTEAWPSETPEADYHKAKRSWRSSFGNSTLAAARIVDELRLKTELAFDFWIPDSAEARVLLNHPRLRGCSPIIQTS